MTRQTLHDLGRHYHQYVEAERLKAAGSTPQAERGEPHFKRRGDRISILLTITHDGPARSARFTGERTIRICRMGDIGLSRPFPVLDYHPKTARPFQTADRRWRMTISCMGCPTQSRIRASRWSSGWTATWATWRPRTIW